KKKDTTSSPNEWTVRVNQISIDNGRFRLDNDSYTPDVTYFDGNHIDFRQINGTANNLLMRGDSIKAAVQRFATMERSGFTVKNLQTNLTIRPKAYEFDKLLLETPNTVLRNHFSMTAQGPKGFGDFVHGVIMNAAFKDAVISSKDLAYFIPDARSWNKVIRIDGKVEGSVDRLSADNLLVRLGTNTLINGNVSVIGLPDINKTLLNIEAKELRTNYTDAVSFFPALRNVGNPNVKALSYLRFKGTFTGFVNDFVSFGTIETALGTLTTDVNMKLPQNGDAIYSGSLSTEGFQLGRLINNPDLGVVDFHGDLSGRSFDWNKMSLTIDGTVHRIRF
ncbi:MAG TPA: hypothetical protein VFL47_02110, partial [Flavisolibacter sp.]|nr:hypothetical protein [Flavisolibacter sp.]